MKALVIAVFGFVGSSFILPSAPVLAETHEHQHGATTAPAEPAAVILPGLGDWHHAVSTKNAEAQKYFDQGLTLVFCFNHDEAIRSFKKAAELDPDLAMAHWGIALALGPNYNDPITPEREKEAFGHIQQAIKLKEKASPAEQDYIDAMAVRYTDAEKPDFEKQAADYRKAMGALSKKYPDDLDAANFYAESMMLLHPWKLWHVDGSPEENTEEIVVVLESIMRREPNHIGANHLYIHAVEASATPERALPSADRLAGLATGAGHIVHMPAHIYMRVGDFEAAATSNEAAIAADKEYFKDRPVQGIYPAMYYSHNVHFLAIADGMRGCSAESRKAADALAAHVGPSVKAMPMLEGFMTIPMFVLVRFNQWDDILATPQPDESMKVTTALWHFGRGMADVNKGKFDEAVAERKKFDEVRGAIPSDAVFSPWNKAGDVLAIADQILIAQFARAKDNHDGEVAALRSAVEKQDSLNYGEPLDWPWPIRESLGAALLRSGDAAGAEVVFREDLAKNPRNGRSLFGLIESLKAQKKTVDMEMLQRQYNEAWKKADVKLTIETM